MSVWHLRILMILLGLQIGLVAFGEYLQRETNERQAEINRRQLQTQVLLNFREHIMTLTPAPAGICDHMSTLPDTGGVMLCP